jgi:hypothetical protein
MLKIMILGELCVYNRVVLNLIFFLGTFLECYNAHMDKNTMIIPDELTKLDIRFHRVIQKAGQFVVALKGTFHQGMNLGPNLAEAWNVASPQWRDEYEDMTLCPCHPPDFYASHIGMLDDKKKTCSCHNEEHTPPLLEKQIKVPVKSDGCQSGVVEEEEEVQVTLNQLCSAVEVIWIFLKFILRIYLFLKVHITNILISYFRWLLWKLKMFRLHRVYLFYVKFVRSHFLLLTS